MVSQNPRDWQAPSWHPDFGDPEAELAMLREFCIDLQDKNKEYTFSLDAFEEGYICVKINKRNKKYAELWIVERQDKKRYGLFMDDGREIYFDDKKEGLAHLL